MVTLTKRAADLKVEQPVRDARLVPPGARLQTGTVKVFLTEREAAIETGDGELIDCRQAASCLLAPTIGDRVLLYVDDSEAHILAVLERSSTRQAEIAVPGASNVALRSTERLEVNAPKVSVVAREVSIFARALSQTGEMLTSNFRRILENVVDKTIGARTITTKADARTAIVRDVDTVNAGTLVQNVDKVATQNSEISLITAKQDVRLDATRVSVG
jgi:hypothetical protein